MLEQKDSHDRLPRWNVGGSVVVHPKLSHKRFPMDGGALVGVESHYLLLVGLF